MDIETADAARVAEIEAIVAAIRPLLAGKPPEIQGAALADLLATWLAGYVAGDEGKTDDLRERLLQHHLRTVRRLLPVNHAMIHGD